MIVTLSAQLAGAQISVFSMFVDSQSPDLKRFRCVAGLKGKDKYRVPFAEKWQSTLDDGKLEGRRMELTKYFQQVRCTFHGMVKS